MKTLDQPTPRTNAEIKSEPYTRFEQLFIDRSVPAQFARTLERELAAATAECLEQARLLGKSAEREADLLGKLERLERQAMKPTEETILVFAFRYALGRNREC